MKNNRRPTLDKSEERQLRIILAFLVITIFIGMIIFIKLYNSYIDKMLYSERLSQMKETTTSLYTGLEQLIDDQWEETEIQCRYLARRNPDNMKAFAGFMKSQEAVNKMNSRDEHIVAVDSKGRYFTKKGCQGTMPEMKYFNDNPEKVSFVFKPITEPEAFLYLVRKLDKPLVFGSGSSRTEILYYGIAHNMKDFNPYLECNAYDGNNSVYLVDDYGGEIFRSDCEDVLEGYNMYKLLEKMEYLHGTSFLEAKKELDRNGVSYSNVILDECEYYYSMYRMKNAKWTLLFVVPSEHVAADVVTLVNTTIWIILVLTIVLIVICAGAITTILRYKHKKELVIQRESNAALKKVNRKLDKKNEQLSKAIERAEKAVEEADLANRAKSIFLSNMSHDIRTPMNAIMGVTQLMAREEDASDKMKAYIEKVQMSGTHLMELINDILDMSRIESGTIALNEESVSLENQLYQLDNIIRSQAAEHNQHFNIETKNIVHNYIISDSLRLRQIIINLLSNAIKYTPDGGTIDFCVEEVKGGKSGKADFLIKVSDNGYGMEKDFLESIFQPFTREENTRTGQIQGTGLGMAITKNIVDLMGGTIAVESELNKGSTFTVALSFPVDTKPHSTCSGANSMEMSSLKGLNLLCAEDNELNREILREFLDIYGIKCHICYNGKELIDEFLKMKLGSFQAVLTDVEMPVMNGIEAVKAIRSSSSAEKDIPVIAMTANAFSEDIKKCMDAGMNGYIIKPIDERKLFEEIRRCVHS